MGVEIRNRKDFEAKFRKLKDKRDLFAFLLFDERPSQQAVGEFANQNFPWLDGLARMAKVFFFIFLKRNPDWEDTENPGPEVGRMFGIKPNQLPGVLIFSLTEDREGVSAGVYLPIHNNLFEGDFQRVEEVFSDLFSLIANVQRQGGTPQDKLARLKGDVAGLQRRQRLYQYRRGAVETLKELPGKLMDSLSAALVQAAVRQGMPLG